MEHLAGPARFGARVSAAGRRDARKRRQSLYVPAVCRAGRILGVRDGQLNCKGFDGPLDSLERGIPGFMPGSAAARNLPNVLWKVELDRALAEYDLSVAELPAELAAALRQRKAFTLVEGVDPLGFCQGRIDASDLLARVLRHDQSALAVQQLRLYAAHNGRVLNGGAALGLEAIAPLPGFEQPVACDIPETLANGSGGSCSTTQHGKRPLGRLVLYTSQENMPNAYRKLRPRWKVSYRTARQMIGSKAVSELAPNAPGAQHIYGLVELAALEPDYVELGRKRPLDGPLLQALDLFIAEAIRGLARAISDRRRKEFDQQALDEVYEENQTLNSFKNRYLPREGTGARGKTGWSEGWEERQVREGPTGVEWRARAEGRREPGRVQRGTRRRPSSWPGKGRGCGSGAGWSWRRRRY